MTILPSGATAVIAILVEEPSTSLSTLWNAIGIGVGVNVNAGGVSLEQGLIPHSPADNIDLDSVIRPTIESGKSSNPLVVGAAGGRGDLRTLLGSNGLRGIPADTVVDLASSGHDLVEAVVFEAECIAIRLDFVVPDLISLDVLGQ
jgi:hypothetical protein